MKKSFAPGGNIQRNLIVAAICIIAIFLAGTIGYRMIEKNWSLLDAIYMTAITLTTVGYTDNPCNDQISSARKIFTIFLIVVGIAVFAYGIGNAMAFIVEGQLSETLRRKKMDNEIARMKNHYIVCGAGDTGIHTINEFLKMESNFIVIEQDESRLKHILESREKLLYIQGDATDDEVLLKAGIEKATGLVTCLAEDKDNLFVVISARSINPKLKIASKATDEMAKKKILRAGANEVIMPDFLGGLKLASLVLRPKVVSFLDIMLYKEAATRFSEATISEGSQLVGISLEEAQIPNRTGLLVVAVQKAEDDNFIYNPRPIIQLDSGDTLIVIGDVKQVRKLKKLANDPTLDD